MVNVLILDYPWRFPDSTTDSNVVKWLYVPDFLTRPKPTFLICEWNLDQTLISSWCFFLIPKWHNPDLLPLFTQMTSCCCCVPPCRGRSLRMRTWRPFVSWPETTWKSAETWTRRRSASTTPSQTLFTAGKTDQPAVFCSLSVLRFKFSDLFHFQKW